MKRNTALAITESAVALTLLLIAVMFFVHRIFLPVWTAKVRNYPYSTMLNLE